MKALIYTPDGDGKAKMEEIPADMAAAAKAAHEKLVEMVAEGDDELMEEFFEKGTLPVGGPTKGLRGAVSGQRIFPVMLSSALHNIGSDAILNLIVDVFPAPAARGKASGFTRAGAERRTGGAKNRRFRASVDLRVQDAFGPFRRPHQLFQGDVRRAEERRQREQLQSRHAGALSARAGDAGKDGRRRRRTARRRYRRHRQTEGHHTGDTLGDKAAPIFYPPARIPEPAITFAIEPKTRADEDRIGQGIHKILEEDLALRFSRDPQTKEFLLAGAGQQHIEVVVAKLRKRFTWT